MVHVEEDITYSDMQLSDDLHKIGRHLFARRQNANVFSEYINRIDAGIVKSCTGMKPISICQWSTSNVNKTGAVSPPSYSTEFTADPELSLSVGIATSNSALQTRVTAIAKLDRE
ncbi:hypothetical protein CBL_07239 [Carabus blaptoides fortunei]